MTEYEWLDGCFRAEKKRWGTWSSYDKDGKELITSLTKEQCILATRFYLKGKQEGFEEVKSYESKIAGKL
jgi:hypothetical protein